MEIFNGKKSYKLEDITMTALVHFLGLLSSFTLAATDLGELVFQDDFERSESQGKKNSIGCGNNIKLRKQATKIIYCGV